MLPNRAFSMVLQAKNKKIPASQSWVVFEASPMLPMAQMHPFCSPPETERGRNPANGRNVA
jgi:hypothetical protein